MQIHEVLSPGVCWYHVLLRNLDTKRRNRPSELCRFNGAKSDLRKVRYLLWLRHFPVKQSELCRRRCSQLVQKQEVRATGGDAWTCRQLCCLLRSRSRPCTSSRNIAVLIQLSSWAAVRARVSGHQESPHQAHNPPSRSLHGQIGHQGLDEGTATRSHSRARISPILSLRTMETSIYLRQNKYNKLDVHNLLYEDLAFIES
jgi:hypothetical protein